MKYWYRYFSTCIAHPYPEYERIYWDQQDNFETPLQRSINHYHYGIFTHTGFEAHSTAYVYVRIEGSRFKLCVRLSQRVTSRVGFQSK